MQCSNCNSYKIGTVKGKVAGRLFLGTIGLTILVTSFEPNPGFYGTLVFIAGFFLSAIILALYDGGHFCKSCGKAQ